MAKEEERAAREAEKAAEEAKTRAQQAAIEEETRKKRDEERHKREAAKRAADEEKGRREEEKRKRQLEEREREQEREKKRKEKEEKLKKEREERDRKAKEERARLAKEREDKAERDRIEKEKKAEKEKLERERQRIKKEKEEKEEREAKEKIAAQKAAAAVAQPKTPIRLSATASASTSSLSTSKSPALSPPLQRSPNTSTGSAVNGIASGSKKLFNGKPVSTSTNSPVNVGQPSRSRSQGSQSQPPSLSRPPHMPPTPVSLSPHLPQQPGMMYGHPPVGQVPVILPPSLSPRVNTFPSMQYPYGNSNMQHPPGTPIMPPSNPQAFNAGPSFDPAVSFNRVPISPLGVPISRGGSGSSPTPIGPPKGKTPLTSISTPGQPMLAGRRASLAAISFPGGPGPITRPIAPIARPSTSTTGDGTTSSGSGSPSRRSPSPKGLLGSSALAADDDEVVPKASARRHASTTPIGTGVPMTPLQSWGPASPRAALGPWSANNFSPSPSRATGPVGSNGNGTLHIQPSVPPTGVESLWNTPVTPNDAWHPQNAGAFFQGPNQFVNHHSAATPAPHGSS